jgi:5-methyltetrahydropteroyltriglutamate--homocysteine methyltransferase
VHAVSFLKRAQEYAHRPVKQAVISASALSLLYPAAGVPEYSQEAFVSDLVDEAERDIRGCLEAGASCVQMDFTEGRLALKLDPSARLLKSFVSLNNRVLERFTAAERRKIGVHTCPGGDHDSTHSADVDYAALLPLLFELEAGRFYIQLASESDPKRVLAEIREHRRPDQLVFVGVIDPIDPVVETREQVRDSVLAAAQFIPLEFLGTTDDCGFSPFADDTSTSRDTAFAKIRSRVEGTELASRVLGV